VNEDDTAPDEGTDRPDVVDLRDDDAARQRAEAEKL
jgi:hypothetical protein